MYLRPSRLRQDDKFYGFAATEFGPTYGDFRDAVMENGELVGRYGGWNYVPGLLAIRIGRGGRTRARR